MKIAWLIGAGFSCQLDMPLVWPLTMQIKRWLTPAKLRQLNAGWRSQRQPVDDAVIAAACDRLENVEETYEQLIGWFQAQRRNVASRHGQIADGYRHLTGLVQSAVGEILFRRHVQVAAALRFMLPWYRGIEAVIPHDAPLWIFSLNHDVCVESIAGDLGIPVSCGYPESEVVSFPTRDGGRRITFDRLRNEHLVAHDFAFDTGRAINLVKLHGSLDVFWYGDRRDFVRVHPQLPTSAGWLASLHDLEEQLPAEEGGQRVVAPGEIAVHDDAGELQFLRRTPVAGAFKFEPNEEYNAPAEFVDFFGQKLNDFDELVVIGYGWADRHINGPVEHWLAANTARRVVNVDPRGVNANVAHLSHRVREIKLGAAEYLCSLRSTQVSAAEVRLRTLRDLLLTMPDAEQRFANAMKTVVTRYMDDALVRLLAAQNVDSDDELAKIVAEINATEDAVVVGVLRELTGSCD